MAAEKKPAKAVKKPAAEAPTKAAKAVKKPAAEAPTKAASAEDDMRRRFEEALDRKRGKSDAGASPHDPGRTVVPQSNTKRQRTFRRKSGG
jgi:hypothetical protein